MFNSAEMRLKKEGEEGEEGGIISNIFIKGWAIT